MELQADAESAWRAHLITKDDRLRFSYAGRRVTVLELNPAEQSVRVGPDPEEEVRCHLGGGDRLPSLPPVWFTPDSLSVPSIATHQVTSAATSTKFLSQFLKPLSLAFNRHGPTFYSWFSPHTLNSPVGNAPNPAANASAGTRAPNGPAARIGHPLANVPTAGSELRYLVRHAYTGLIAKLTNNPAVLRDDSAVLSVMSLLSIDWEPDYDLAALVVTDS